MSKHPVGSPEWLEAVRVAFEEVFATNTEPADLRLEEVLTDVPPEGGSVGYLAVIERGRLVSFELGVDGAEADLSVRMHHEVATELARLPLSDGPEREAHGRVLVAAMVDGRASAVGDADALAPLQPALDAVHNRVVAVTA